MWMLLALPALGADLSVVLQGESAPVAHVRCRLFDVADAPGFPSEPTERQVSALPDEQGQPVCRFKGLPAGRYAVSAILDQNDNGLLDTSFVGIPVEPWGVTRDARPAMRAPSFDEAAVVVASNQSTRAVVRLAR